MAIAFGAAQQFGNLSFADAGPVFTRSLTVADAGGVLLACFWAEAASDAVESVTFAGVAMDATAVNLGVTGVWTMLDAPVGTADLVVTLSPYALVMGAAIVVTGVDLSNAFGAVEASQVDPDESNVAETLSTEDGQSLFSFIIGDTTCTNVGTPSDGQSVLWYEAALLADTYVINHAATVIAPTGAPSSDVSWIGGADGVRAYASLGLNPLVSSAVIVHQVVLVD